MKNTLGDYLKSLRGNRSLRDISKLTNNSISHAYIANIENSISHRGNIIKPTPDTLKILANVYNVDYLHLLHIAGYIDYEVKPMPNQLGTYLRSLRGKQSLRGISEKTQLRLSHSYISDLENGYSRKKKPIQPSPETLKILSEVYNVKYYELMELAGYLEPQDTQNISHSTNSIEQELNKMIRDLTHGDAQSINDMDENTKELLIMSLENSLRIAQRESKKK